MLYLHFLGTFHVTLEDKREPTLETVKAKALLAYLAMENARPHLREQLATMFWPESDQRAAHQNLRQALYVLRQQLHLQQDGDAETDTDSAYLTITRQQVSFNTSSAHWIDAVRFSELVRSTQAHIHRRLDACPQCVGRLEAATELYAGDFLSGLTVPDAVNFEAWRTARQESLHRDALVAFEAVASYYERRSEMEKAHHFFARRLDLEPWDEETHRRIMRLLMRDSKRSAALQQFELCQHILKTEFGLEPAPETLALLAQIQAGTLPAEARPNLNSPYKGLHAFGIVDAADYFGREAVIDHLRQILLVKPAVVIVGPSGGGKSSLLRAGLLPNLPAPFPPARHESVQSQPGTPWTVIECRLGSDPFLALAQAMAGSTHARASAAALATQLRGEGANITDYISIPAGTRAILCIDPLEELFTLCQAASVRRAFLDLLSNTIQANASPISIIGALRADFVSQALTYRPLTELLQHGSLILGPMDRNELRRAIQEPARNRGVAFEAGLIERLLDDVSDEPGNLPLLQFALSELWLRRNGNKLTHDAYDAIGNVGGALAHYADSVYSQLLPAEQLLARRLFVQLVHLGDETGNSRRPATRPELGEDIWQLAQRLADLRLVVTGRDRHKDSVELIHEALIRSWDRLQQWIEEDREFRRWQQRLRVYIVQWTASHREPDALLRGLLLSEAEQWASQRRSELSEVERTYIDSSLANQAAQRVAAEQAQQLALEQAQEIARIERERAEAEYGRAELERAARRRLRLLTIGITAALALAVVAAIAAAILGIAGQQSAKEALARQLAAQATNLADDNTNLALLLSTEALARLERPADRTSFLTNFPVHALLDRFFENGSGDIRQITRSADGSQLLTLNALGSKTEVVVWDDASARPVRTLLPATELNGTALSLDGSLLATAEGNRLQIRDNTRGEIVATFETDEGREINSVQFTATNDMLALKISGEEGITQREGYTGTFVLWDVRSQSERSRFTIPDFRETAYLSPDGSVVAITQDLEGDLGIERGVNLWDVATGTETGIRLGNHASNINQVAYSPEMARIATASSDGTVRLWDASSGELLHAPFTDHGGRVLSVAFSPDGRVLATGGFDRRIFLYDLRNDKPIGEALVGHNNWIRSLYFSPQGEFLYSGATDGEIIRWNLATHLPFDGHTDRVRSVALSPDGTLLASAGIDRRVLLWDAHTGEKQAELSLPHERAIIQLAFSPDGKKLATVDAGNRVVIWDVARRMPPGTSIVLPGETVLIGLAFSPDSRYVATGDFQGTVTILDADTNQLLCSRAGTHAGWALTLAFAPDGKSLASGGTDGAIRLWDTANLAQTCLEALDWTDDSTLPHASWVTSLLFSSDGSTLISGSSDNSVKFWDLATGEQIGEPLLGQKAQVWGLAFYPPHQEKSLLTLGGDGSVMLWDIAKRTPWGPALHTALETEAFAVSPDGASVYLASTDMRAERWHLRPPPWEQHSCAIAARQLTQEEWGTFLGNAPYRPACKVVEPSPEHAAR